jgi:hypothetical protein
MTRFLLPLLALPFLVRPSVSAVIGAPVRPGSAAYHVGPPAAAGSVAGLSGAPALSLSLPASAPGLRAGLEPSLPAVALVEAASPASLAALGADRSAAGALVAAVAARPALLGDPAVRAAAAAALGVPGVSRLEVAAKALSRRAVSEPALGAALVQLRRGSDVVDADRVQALMSRLAAEFGVMRRDDAALGTTGTALPGLAPAARKGRTRTVEPEEPRRPGRALRRAVGTAADLGSLFGGMALFYALAGYGSAAALGAFIALTLANVMLREPDGQNAALGGASLFFALISFASARAGMPGFGVFFLGVFTLVLALLGLGEFASRKADRYDREHGLEGLG